MFWKTTRPLAFAHASTGATFTFIVVKRKFIVPKERIFIHGWRFFWVQKPGRHPGQKLEKALLRTVFGIEKLSGRHNSQTSIPAIVN